MVTIFSVGPFAIVIMKVVQSTLYRVIVCCISGQRPLLIPVPDPFVVWCQRTARWKKRGTELDAKICSSDEIIQLRLQVWINSNAGHFHESLLLAGFVEFSFKR